MRRWLLGRFGARGQRKQIRNILVLSEHFRVGGLETQVRSQARFLAERGVRLHLATSSPPSPSAEAIFASTLCDLPMDTTPDLLLETVAQVEECVDRHEIDVIHAHPFLSFAVAMVVAQRRRLPLVATLHGPSSVSAGNDTVYDLLFRNCLLPGASLLLAVSEEVRFLARAACPSCKAEVLPNAVELPRDEAPPLDLRLPWMWAGRIDEYKIVGLRCLVAEVLRRRANVLHIYGAGPSLDELRQQLAREDPQSSWIGIRDWDDELVSRMASYSLIAGMGRVVLEAAAASRPALLVGYDGIKGVLTVEGMARAAGWNFSGRGMRSISSIDLDRQLVELGASPHRFIHREWVRDHASAEAIWETYWRKLSALRPFRSDIVNDFVGCLMYSGSNDSKTWGDNGIFRSLNNLVRFHREKAR